MRLQYLKLENITSLKGQHYIDFAKMGRQSDLFAITGPTGSGKSTLLMAIAMALYGQNHKGLTAADLVTTHCPYGKIELSFDLHGKNYIVQWSCQTLKKDGTPRKVALTQRHWSANSKEISTDAEEVIGLSWDQFTKVIILNQGQFSEFLTSTFNKRKEILEKLMGHGQLEVLGKHLRRKLSDLDAQINSLKGQSDFAKIMSDDEFSSLTAQREEIKLLAAHQEEMAKKCLNIARIISEDIKLKEKRIEINKQYETKSQGQEILQREMSAIQKSLKLAEENLHKQQKYYKERKPLLKDAAENDNQISKTQIKIDQLNKTQLITQAQLSQKRKQAQTNKSQLDDLTQKEALLVKEIAFRDNEKLKSIKVTHQSLSQKLSFIQRRLDTTLAAKLEAQNIEKEGKENKSILLDKLHTHYLPLLNEHEIAAEIAPTIDKEDFTKLSTLLEKLAHDLTQKEEILKNREEEIKMLLLQQDVVKNQKIRINEQWEAHISKRDEVTHNLKDLESKSRALEEELKKITAENKKWELLKLSYESLKDHESDHITGACPVCATQGINWEEVFLPLMQQSDEGLLQQKKLEDQFKTTRNSLESQKIQESELAKREKELTLEAKEIQERFDQYNEDINTKRNYIQKGSLDYFHKTKEATKEQLYELRHFLKGRESLIKKWNENETLLKQLFSELKTSWGEIENLVPEVLTFSRTLVLPQFITSDLNKTSQNISNFFQEIELLGKEIDQQVTKENEWQILKEKLLALNKSIEALNQDIEGLGHQMNELSTEEQELATTLSTLQNKATINKYPKNPQKELEDIENTLELARGERDHKTKEKIDIETRYRQGSEQINNLKDRLEELEKLHQLYIGELTKEQQNVMTLQKDAPEIDDEELDFRISDETWNKHLNKYIQSPWGKELNQPEFQLDQQFLFESIQPEAQQAQESSIQIKEKSAAIEQEIKTYNEQQARIAKLTAKIGEKKRQWEQFEVLNHYIGKDRFRDFALTILENTLLDMANHEIKSLAEGRYELLHARAGKRSEFMVKDHWHGGIERKVSTLSGGETFLLSLGLAMGLSDITRGQTEIESFFIDEGFGTLDDESIAQVLDCLMAIQSRGKQIGLISHVTSLTSQIPVRLEVTKNNFGESSLSMN